MLGVGLGLMDQDLWIRKTNYSLYSQPVQKSRELVEQVEAAFDKS